MPVHSKRFLLLCFVLGAASGACNKGSDESPSADHGVCDVLIECAATLAPEVRDEFEEGYGTNGTCWLIGPEAWAACRESCATTLEGLNLMAGSSCGTCSTHADCSEFGPLAQCQAGLCSGGGGTGGGEQADDDPDEEDEDTNTGDGDGEVECVEIPSQCEAMLACLAVVLPDADTSMFEPGGACWCTTQLQAAECAQTCIDQLEAALEQNPDVDECGGDSCPIGTEGCACSTWVPPECEGVMECNNGICEVPEFGTCAPDDVLCPANGCANGTMYVNVDDDNLPDYAMCHVPCEDDSDCYDEGLDYCVESFYFTSGNFGLTCIRDCYWGCPDGSVCANSVGDFCIYEKP